MEANAVVELKKDSMSDLIVDALYKSTEGIAAKPLQVLLNVGNAGGFRISRKDKKLPHPEYVALYTDGRQAEWPDALDVTTGLFTYYGDNRRPGGDLHNTSNGGNKHLQKVFSELHLSPTTHALTPFFIFEKGPSGWSSYFRGVAVPGGSGISASDDLVAIWRTTNGARFQNYRATFTILDIPRVTRAWIDELLEGNTLGPNAPAAWRKWVTTGRYTPLTAPPTISHRTKIDQLPQDTEGMNILNAVYAHFKDRPTDFESCAVEIWRLQSPNVANVAVTRAVVDGGRDAIGQYQMGPSSDPIMLDFALEAKCYEPTHSLGVRATNRLISRLLHRQFGVLVTTYKEIREDKHPVVIIAGADLVRILRGPGQMSTQGAVQEWLDREFPAS